MIQRLQQHLTNAQLMFCPMSIMDRSSNIRKSFVGRDAVLERITKAELATFCIRICTQRFRERSGNNLMCSMLSD